MTNAYDPRDGETGRKASKGHGRPGRPFVKYGGLTKEEWLASPEGRAWLRKVRERDGDVSLSARFGTMLVGDDEGQTVAMGWNGVPSDRQLRRRRGRR